MHVVHHAGVAAFDRIIATGQSAGAFQTLQEWLTAAAQMGGAGFAQWVTQTMQLSKADRKSISHDGAIRIQAGEPRHWPSPDGLWYRDPGNATYARAFRSAYLFVPLNLSVWQQDFHNETLGDLMEIALAMAYRVQSPENEDFRHRVEKLVRATEALDAMLPELQFIMRARVWASAVHDLRVWLSIAIETAIVAAEAAAPTQAEPAAAPTQTEPAAEPEPNSPPSPQRAGGAARWARRSLAPAED